MESQALIDRQVVSAQIGRSPRGDVAVAVRCSYGFPQVIRVHPVMRGRPFPTLYWLTCPFLSKQVDHLEAAGRIKHLEHLLKNQTSLRDGMLAAHVSYRDVRAALLTGREKRALESAGQLNALSERGIGGIADWQTLKCLHLHVAHALVDKNPIGEIVLGDVTDLECLPEQVICSAYC